MMLRFAPVIAWFALCAFALPAGAGVLYRCDANDGSTAYTSSRDGFRNCKVIETFVSRPVAPAAAPKPPVASKPRTTATQRWVYEENPAPPKPDFSNVFSAVRVHPPEAARPTFSRVWAGVDSTAPILVPEDFSGVSAGVASTARELEPPTFIAARYRQRRMATVASPAPAPVTSAPLADSEATPAATPPVRTQVVRGSVYRVQRRDGIVEYTNIRPKGGAFAVLFTYISTCVACDVRSKIDFARTALNLDAYRDEVAAAAADFGIDVALLRAVIHAESAFNPMALSNKGAQGLMQLMPGTANDLGVTDAFDVGQNIRGGARYLSQLMQTFKGDAHLATAAYNAGPGAVQRYGGVPPYDETQVYVQRVATLRDRYRKAM